MARSSNLFYNEAAVAVIIDGQVGTQFADEFSIRITPPEDNASLTVGLDGASSSIAANRTCEAMVSFRPTSPSLDIFYQLYLNQNNGQGRLFNVSVNTGVGERLHLNGCLIKNVGEVETGGKQMTIRQVSLTCQELVFDQSLF